MSFADDLRDKMKAPKQPVDFVGEAAALQRYIEEICKDAAMAKKDSIKGYVGTFSEEGSVGGIIQERSDRAKRFKISLAEMQTIIEELKRNLSSHGFKRCVIKEESFSYYDPSKERSSVAKMLWGKTSPTGIFKGSGNNVICYIVWIDIAW